MRRRTTKPDYRFPVINVSNNQLAWLAGYMMLRDVFVLIINSIKD